MSAYELWRVEVSYTNGAWTDITADVDTMTAPVAATTGSSAETTGDPATLSLVLHNPGFKYTPGNLLSSFALSSGLPIRFSEAIAGQTIYLFSGFIEFPEISSVNMSMTQDQTLQVNAVDQLSRWERSPTFVSTLASYIDYAEPNLTHYWPLADASGSTQATNLINPAAPMTIEAFVGTAPTASSVGPLLQFGSQEGPPGDDGNYPVWNDAANGYRLRLVNRVLPGVTPSSSSFLLLSCWVYHPEPVSTTAQILLRNTAQDLSVQISSVPVWSASISNPTGNVTLTGAAPKTAGWQYVAVTVDCSATGAVALHVDANTPVTGNLASAPFVGTMQHIVLDGPDGSSAGGSIGHVQVSLTGTYTATTHAAQFQMGLSGLDRQSTGERIKTIARYAGKTDADLTLVDSGGSIMQRAELAGLTVADAMYQARDTEQGELFIDGSGLLNFDDRRTLLNI